MTQIHIVLPGQPVGKGRPRFGGGRAYTPKKSKDYEQLLAAEARQEMDQFNLEATELPCKMIILAQFAIPKSWAKWRQQAAQLGEYTPGRPDIDNVAKSALDAFNGIVYVDDAQVYDLQIKKTYGQPLLIASVSWDE